MRLFAAKSPTVIEFVLIEEGTWHESKRGPNGNQVYMTAEQIRASATLFDGLPVQAIDRKANLFDHMPNEMKNELSAEGARFLLKDVVGFIRTPRVETLANGKLGVVAPIHFHDERVATTLRAAVEGGDLGFTGGSIDGTPQRWENKIIDGKPYDTVWLGELDTWDLATFPAAGGRMLRLAASRLINNDGESHMNLTAKQKAILHGLLSAAGVKGDALEKAFTDDADFGKEALAAIRVALAGKADLLLQFDVLAQKLEKGEDVENTFKALSELKFDDAKTEADASADKAKADADMKAKADTDAAEAKRKADLETAKTSDDPAVKQAAAILEQAQKANDEVNTKLGEIEIEKHVTASRLPDLAKTKLSQILKLRREYDTNRIKASIDAEANYISAIAPGKYLNGDRLSASFEMGEAEIDTLLLGVQGMFTKEQLFNSKKEAVKPIRSFRELHRLTASADENYDAEKMFRRLALGLSRGHNDEGLGFQASDFLDAETGRLTASLTTGDLPLIFGTAMHRQMAKEYRIQSYQDWRKVVEIVNFSDLRTRQFERFGGYAAAPIVAEQGTYTEATSPSEEQVGLSIYKYGIIESITEEMIINDDIGSIQRITKALGRGMAIDVYHMVFDPITNNDAVAYGSDTSTLIHANHANGSASGGGVLTQTSWQACVQRMMAQSAFGESRAYLENYPKYIMCGYKQEFNALQVANPVVLAQLSAATGGGFTSGANFLPNTGLPNAYGLADGAVITLKHITSATNWWAIADPSEVPVMLVAFHNGKDTPEIVTEAANSGSHFSADKIRMKVKLRRGAVLNDHRAIDGQLA